MWRSRVRILNRDTAPLPLTTPGTPTVLPLKIRDRQYLFDSLSLVLLEGDTVEYRASHKAPVTPPRRTPPRNPYIVLNLTYRCQLACRYCFVQKDDDRPLEDMSIATALRAIRHLVPPGPVPHIGFFGGEPTLNPDTLQAVVLVTEKLAEVSGAKPPAFGLTTNGVEPSKSPGLSSFLLKRRFSYIVSLDGPPELHNALRPMRSGEDSHSAALGFLDLARAAGVSKHITLRGTYTAGRTNIVARLEYLNDLVARGCAGHVSVEPVSLCANNCPTEIRGLAFSPEDLAALRNEYEAVAEWTIARVRAGLPAHCHQVSSMVRRLWERRPHVSECGAGRGYITVDPQGDYYACHRAVGEPIGSLWGGTVPEAIEAWRDNTLCGRPKCSACPIRFVCGGGCRAESLDAGLDIGTPVATSCAIRMAIFRAAVMILDGLTPDQITQYLPHGRR